MNSVAPSLAEQTGFHVPAVIIVPTPVFVVLCLLALVGAITLCVLWLASE